MANQDSTDQMKHGYAYVVGLLRGWCHATGREDSSDSYRIMSSGHMAGVIGGVGEAF